MARPKQNNIEYFSFNVNFFDDTKILFVSNRFGFKGEIVAIKLLCWIYKTEGYFTKWNDELAMLFVKRELNGSMPITLVNDIVFELLKRDLFNRGLFEKFDILTSTGIQKRWIEATKRRGSEIKKDYNLLSYGIEKNTITPVVDTITPVVDTITPVVDTETGQSKVKESIVNESKENDINYAPQIYFKLKGLIVNEKISEYFYNNHRSFADQWMMKNDPSQTYTESVFEKIDTDYSYYEFSGESHIQNTFKSVYNEVLKSKIVAPKKESSLKAVIDSRNEARDRIIAKHASNEQ